MEQTQSFLLSLGYTKEVSQGIINALLQNGISPNMLFGMVKTLAGRYEIGEDAGLDALADSVKAEQLTKHGMKKVRIVCLPSTGWSSPPNDADDDASLPIIHSMDRAFVVEATEGTTLTDVAKFGTSDNCDVLGEYLECACSGIMACSTCHVVIHPDWYDASLTPSSSSDTVQRGGMKKIGPPSEAEQDMIDLAFEPQVTSRLGCQIELTTDLDGLVILLPRGSNNLMDHIPFE
jgi:2Fe-2S ferredoxin